MVANAEISERVELWNRRDGGINVHQAQLKTSPAYGEWTLLCAEMYWPAYLRAGRVNTPVECCMVFQDEQGRPCIKCHKQASVHFLTAINFVVLNWTPADPPAPPPTPEPMVEPENEVDTLKKRIAALEAQNKQEFKCVECGKLFTTRAGLDGHTRIHLKGKTT